MRVIREAERLSRRLSLARIQHGIGKADIDHDRQPAQTVAPHAAILEMQGDFRKMQGDRYRKLAQKPPDLNILGNGLPTQGSREEQGRAGTTTLLSRVMDLRG